MKIADTLKVSAGKIDFTVNASGEYPAEVSCGQETFLRLGRIVTAGFSGALSLPEKLRCHRTNDNLCAEFDSVNVIPFGCEYRVKRHWTLFNNIALLNCDIAADNGGVIRDLELEPVEFILKPAKVEFLIRGENQLRTAENADGVLYSGNAAVLMLRVSDAGGRQAEYICGDDTWRHCAAEKIDGASSLYEITVSADRTVLTRKVLITSDETVMEKRPWKFKSIFSWFDPAAIREKSESTAQAAETKVINDCFASAGAHRELRKFVRSSKGGQLLQICGTFPRLCDDPAHLERPAKNPIAHSDLGAAAADFLWANRELVKRGGQLVMTGSSQLYGNSAALENLKSTAPLTRFEED